MADLRLIQAGGPTGPGVQVVHQRRRSDREGGAWLHDTALANQQDELWMGAAGF